MSTYYPTNVLTHSDIMRYIYNFVPSCYHRCFRRVNRFFHSISKCNSLISIEKVLTELCKTGDIYILKYIFRKRHLYEIKHTEYLCQVAAKNGHMDIVYFLIEKGCVYERTAALLAETSQYDFLLEFMRRGYDDGSWMYSVGRNVSDVILLEKLYQHTKDCYKSHLINSVKSNAWSYEKLLWLLEKKCDIDEQLFSVACHTCDTRSVNLLLEKSCPFDEYAIEYAIKSKEDTEKVKEFVLYLREKGCPWVSKQLHFLREEG